MLLSLYNIFVFIALGYFANRARMLGKKQSGILLGFLLNFSLPAQIFNGIYHIDFDLALLGMIVSALVIGIFTGVLMFVFGKFVLKTNKATLITLTFLASFGNTLFLGVPIVQGALGAEFAHKAILYDQLCTGLPLAFIAPLILALGGKGVLSARAISMRLFRNPMFLALLTGIFCKMLPFELNENFLSPLYAIGACATPVALFSVGVQLSFLSVKDVWRETAVLLSFKMLLMPFMLFCALMAFGVGFSDDWRMILLQACMPPLVSAAAVIMQAGLNSKLAISSVALGVILSGAISPFFLLLSYF